MGKTVLFSIILVFEIEFVFIHHQKFKAPLRRTSDDIERLFFLLQSLIILLQKSSTSFERNILFQSFIFILYSCFSFYILLFIIVF